MSRYRSLLLGLIITMPLWCGLPSRKPSSARNVIDKTPNPDIAYPGDYGELVDPSSGRSKAIGPLSESRSDFQATLMSDGRVLITGGSLRTASSEWFEESSRRFIPGPPMVEIRQGHQAIPLRNGALLVLGGTEKPSQAECLLPGAERFKSLTEGPRFSLTSQAVELLDGRVLLMDGAIGKAYLWDSKKGFKSGGTLAHPRILFRAGLTKDGKVLITGGWGSASKSDAKGLPIECFNPKWDSWSTWRGTAVPRAKHRMFGLPGDRICLYGGFGTTSENMAETLEILDPGRESIQAQRQKPMGNSPFPGLVNASDGEAFVLAEQSGLLCKMDISRLSSDGADLPKIGKLANQYLEPTLIPFRDGNILVMGTPIWGASMERWDPRSKQCSEAGTLRAGTNGLRLSKDGKAFILGVVVDQLDPKTGTIKPIGWTEDLTGLISNLKPHEQGVAGSAGPPFPKGTSRKDYLVVELGKDKALVIGGTATEDPTPERTIQLWDRKRKTLTQCGQLKTGRTFAMDKSPRSCSGGILLPDGSVLIWGPAKE